MTLCMYNYVYAYVLAYSTVAMKLYKPIITCFSNHKVCGDYKYCIIVNAVMHA